MKLVWSYAITDGTYIENDVFKETPESQLEYWTKLQVIHLILYPSSQPTQPKHHAAGKPQHWPCNRQTPHSDSPYCLTPKNDTLSSLETSMLHKTSSRAQD